MQFSGSRFCSLVVVGVGAMVLAACVQPARGQPADVQQLEARLEQTLGQLRAAQQRKNQLGEEVDRLRQRLAEAQAEAAAAEDASLSARAQLAVLRREHYQLLAFVSRVEGLADRWRSFTGHDGFNVTSPQVSVGGLWHAWPYYEAHADSPAGMATK
ncbi:MAG: hypothetical protein ACFCVE_00315 [Phycisphaerae bacterium]